MEMLAQSKVPLDEGNICGSTPIMVAASYGNAEALRVLLDHGADPEASSRLGLSAKLWIEQAAKEARDSGEMPECLALVERALLNNLGRKDKCQRAQKSSIKRAI